MCIVSQREYSARFEGIIAGEYTEGDAVQVDTGNGGLIFGKAAATQDESA